MIKITIFHYHLKPGGVTQVITAGATALLNNAPDISEITLVSGSAENCEEVVSTIKNNIKKTNKRITYDVVPEIGYISEMQQTPSASVISREITSRYLGTIWWVHNHHIGKNPYFTDAILKTAMQQETQKIVLHIHDFPECARFENLRQIRKVVQEPLYPPLSNVRFVLINERDKKYLIQAGVPEDQVFLVYNPADENKSWQRITKQEKITKRAFESIPIPRVLRQRMHQALLQERGSKKNPSLYQKEHLKIRQRIDEIAGSYAPNYDPEAKNLIYPVRTIRRKNVIEAGLLTKISPAPTNLLVTLPGTSKQEKEYSALVESCFTEKLIPGAWAFGEHLEDNNLSFPELVQSADMLISSSIQEGFGYFFLNAVQWKVPLFARYIEILDGMEKLFQTHPHYFYHKIMVPITLKKRKKVEKAYFNRIKTLQGFLPPGASVKLEDRILKLCNANIIDFSFLSAKQQKKYLLDLHKDKRLLEDVRALNKNLLQAFNNTLNAKSVPSSGKVMRRRFGHAAHAKGILKVIHSFDKACSLCDNRSIHRAQDQLVLKFMKPEYIRLLYE